MQVQLVQLLCDVKGIINAVGRSCFALFSSLIKTSLRSVKGETGDVASVNAPTGERLIRSPVPLLA